MVILINSFHWIDRVYMDSYTVYNKNSFKEKVIFINLKFKKL